MKAVRIDAGQTRPSRSGMLNSRGCDTITGAGGSFSGRSSESRERNGSGRSDPVLCTTLGKTSRNSASSNIMTVREVAEYLKLTEKRRSTAMRTTAISRALWSVGPKQFRRSEIDSWIERQSGREKKRGGKLCRNRMSTSRVPAGLSGLQSSDSNALHRMSASVEYDASSGGPA